MAIASPEPEGYESYGTSGGHLPFPVVAAAMTGGRTRPPAQMPDRPMQMGLCHPDPLRADRLHPRASVTDRVHGLRNAPDIREGT